MVDGRLQAQRLRKRLDDAFQRYGRVGNDAEVQADFSRYLCVLMSGYIEQTIYILFHEFTRKKTEKRVLRYVAAGLERFQNPSSEKIANLVGSFDADWKTEFETYVDGERKESVNSVVSLRNAVAHGEPSGTTYRQLMEFRPRIYEVVDWLVQRLSSPGR